MSISDNIDFLSRLPKIADFAGAPPPGRLSEISDFGANPGNLSMWTYVPPDLPMDSPLVVVLHGCTQTAAAFDHGSGWSALADREGFALLYPEQRRGNNPNLCFNWFDPNKTARGGGEVLSIHRMIAAMVRLHRVSASRIYIVGLSAGGAMASAMLAAYPEVFAGGAIIAGLPHGVASNLREALSAMAMGPKQSRTELGELVREASSHEGRWPRISMWHGADDRTVHPANANQIAAQWIDLHRLPATPTAEHAEGRHRVQRWRSADGSDVVQLNLVDGMAHGVPLDVSGTEDSLGSEGPFMLNTGIASTQHIADFFGLSRSPQSSTKPSTEHLTPPSVFTSAKPHVDFAKLTTRVLAAFGLK